MIQITETIYATFPRWHKNRWRLNAALYKIWIILETSYPITWVSSYRTYGLTKHLYLCYIYHSNSSCWLLVVLLEARFLCVFFAEFTILKYSLGLISSSSIKGSRTSIFPKVRSLRRKESKDLISPPSMRAMVGADTPELTDTSWREMFFKPKHFKLCRNTLSNLCIGKHINIIHNISVLICWYRKDSDYLSNLIYYAMFFSRKALILNISFQNLLHGTDKIMLQGYMILLATLQGQAYGSWRKNHTVG